MSDPIATIILCGGKGTRAYPLTEELPKPLLPLAGVPVLEHVMGVYTRRGFRRFVLALGYLGERIVEHFAGHEGDAELDFVDTGPDTATAERIRRCAHRAGDTFFVTYADGLANIDLARLLAAHRDHGRGATVTTVPLPSQYGTLELDDGDRVVGFREKPQLRDHWINAGFFVFRADLFRRYAGDDLERDVLPSLAHAGELNAWRHDGFWRSLDTYKDLQELDALASRDPLPWH